MPVLSGKTGYVEATPESGGSASLLLDFVNGNLDHGAAIEEFFARSGAGSSETIEGGFSGSGQFTVQYNDANIFDTSFASGDLVTLTFVHNPTGPRQATGRARIGMIGRTINRDGTIQQLVVNFTTHLSWTFS